MGSVQLMNLLTIDLGDTTGWCIFRDGELYLHGTRPLAQVAKAWEASAFDKVVLERPALVESGEKAKAYADVVAQLAIMFKGKLQTVRPTDWKQRYNHFPLPGRGVLKSQHEKDAFRIGAWFLRMVAE